MSATGSTEVGARTAIRAPGRRGAGFSLLELLVAIAILVSVTGLALLASGGGASERRGSAEMDRFALKFQLLCDRAVIESRLLGMALSVNAYEGSELTLDGWQSLGREESFRQLRLPEGWQWQLALEGALRELPLELPAEPQLICLPDGRSTPFRLQLGDQANGWMVRSDGIGAPRLSSAQP
jgi:general secretion pathway protein H